MDSEYWQNPAKVEGESGYAQTDQVFSGSRPMQEL